MRMGNMEYKYINKIDSPADLKALKVEELPEVCAELRQFIIEALSTNPGHLGSSLGTIELTVALHYVFNTPKDKLVWDVGHQAYAHKILTGRRDRFHTNRQFKGLSPFTNPKESEYDAFIAGHASNSISAALGMNIGGERNVVAIIGDGAMTGGLAFEGLNNTSMDKNNLLIVLNDNNMAIDPSVGAFKDYLVDVSTSQKYNKLKEVSRSFNFLIDFLGFRVTAIDVQHDPRADEEGSSYTLGKLLTLAFHSIIADSNKPLYISVALGFGITVISFLLAIFNVVAYFFDSTVVPGYTTTIFSIWFATGILLLMMGIIGLYIGKIFDQVKQRPIFIVMETVNTEEEENE